MQATNKPLVQKSRCMYCGSLSRGKGCRYGPSGVHFHSDDVTKCSYCGSTSYGRGCKINPFNDLHVHGTAFNSMYKEYVQSILDNKTLLRELKKDFKDFQAYKLGLIDEKGNKIKSPVLENELAAFTPTVKTIIKLKKYLGSKVELLDMPTTLIESKHQTNINPERYAQLLTYKDRLADAINDVYFVLDEAQSQGFLIEDIFTEIKA